MECDLHSVYGIDVDDRQAMAGRSWRWLETRIVGLLTDTNTRTWRALNPQKN